jgi:hypothetical protein
MIVIICFYCLMGFACYPTIRGFWFDIMDSGMSDLLPEEQYELYLCMWANKDKLVSFLFSLVWPTIIITLYIDTRSYPGSLIFTNKVYR